MASRGRNKPSLHGLSQRRLETQKDFEDFFKELKIANDRACALIGAAIIDHELIDLLQCRMIILEEDEMNDLFFNRNAILGSLSAKITMAYALGLINETEKKHLSVIRKIRNVFAHSVHQFSFEDELIAKECRILESKHVTLSAQQNAPHRGGLSR